MGRRQPPEPRTCAAHPRAHKLSWGPRLCLQGCPASPRPTRCESHSSKASEASVDRAPATLGQPGASLGPGERRRRRWRASRETLELEELLPGAKIRALWSRESHEHTRPPWESTKLRALCVPEGDPIAFGRPPGRRDSVGRGDALRLAAQERGLESPNRTVHAEGMRDRTLRARRGWKGISRAPWEAPGAAAGTRAE